MKHSKFVFTLAVLCLGITSLISCRKLNDVPATMSATDPEQQFFYVRPGTDPRTVAAVRMLERKNAISHFVPGWAGRFGYPVWEKAYISTRTNAVTSLVAGSVDAVTIIHIPLLFGNELRVHTGLVVRMGNADTSYRLIRDDQYDEFGFENTADSLPNAAKLFTVFANHERNLFGRTRFRILDNRILNGLPGIAIDTTHQYALELDTLAGNVSNASAPITSSSCLMVQDMIAAGYTVQYHMVGTACIIDSYYFGNAGGSGSGTGGGTGPGGPNGGDSTTAPGWEPDENLTYLPCVLAALINSNAGKLFRPVNVRNQLSTLTASIAADTLEKSFSFGWDDTNASQVTAIHTGVTYSASVIVADPNFTVQAAVHTHPATAYSVFSAGDFYTIASGNKINPHFRHFFVTSSSGTMYALSVYDADKLAAFVAAHPRSINFDTASHSWNTDEDIGWYFKLAKKEFENQGYSEDAAEEGAMAYIIRKFDMGLALARQSATGQFEGLYVNETRTGLVLTPISVQKTDLCNF